MTMFIEQLRGMILRDLQTLRNELLAYAEDERQIWALPPGVNNSAGTLALHLTGNLRHYIGACFGGTGYERDRQREFEVRNLPLEELLSEIDRTMADVNTALAALSETAREETYPLEVGGVKLQTSEFLFHLAVHLGYHLGQLDGHRRTVTGKNRSVRALNVRDLSSARTSAAD
jgi:uncharacterized damage-inducible protein DinB